jgi:hypothetical protein
MNREDFKELVFSLRETTDLRLLEIFRRHINYNLRAAVASNRVASPAMLLELAGDQHVEVHASSVILRDSVYDSYAEMMQGITPALQSFAQTHIMTNIQASMSAMTSSIAEAIDTAQIQTLLATASAFTADLSDQEIDERVEEFFESHLDLAGSIERCPALYAMPKADRRLVVWLVGIIVTLYVGTTLLQIGTDNPELKAFIDAFGLDLGGGVPAGISAGAATNKLLKKLPQKDSEE